MSITETQSQIQDLRSGDRIRYHGVDWDIEDYSTYRDREGYQTDEWLLKSSGGTEYYLLREYDSEQPSNFVTWYISNPVHNCRLLVPESKEDILPFLWGKMQTDDIPYPELQLFYKSYYFESRTQGKYESTDTTLSRITWDYWDQDHLTNLAIEAFPNGKLDIYSTKIVKLEDFSYIQKGVVKKSSNLNFDPSLLIESIIAIIMLLVGVFMMIFG
jgi:Domain of unknown function (DUF4178)